ncbi:MAG: hypothetical protein U0586_03915 [Candidatus Brocadiaceae bacterium]
MRAVEALSALFGLTLQSANDKLLKIGQYAEGEFGRPCVTAQLKCRVNVVFEIDGWSLCLNKELTNAADAEAIIRGLRKAAYLDGILMDDVFICLCIAFFRCLRPNRLCLKMGQRTHAEAGFRCMCRSDSLPVPVKPLNEFINFL